MTSLEPQRASTRVLGVDVGGTKIAGALVTRDGSIEGRSLGERTAREPRLPRPDARAARLAGRVERALTSVGRYLGAAIAGFVNALEPELVVIGGGYGEAAAEFLLVSARDVLAQDALPPGRDNRAQLGGDAGVIGAGLIAFEALDAGT